jgi:hypothetical protein
VNIQIRLPPSLLWLSLSGFSSIPPDLSYLTQLKSLLVSRRALRQPWGTLRLPSALGSLRLPISLPGTEQPQWGRDHSLLSCTNLTQLELYFTRHRSEGAAVPVGKLNVPIPDEIHRLALLDQLELYAYRNTRDPDCPSFRTCIVLPPSGFRLPALSRVQLWADSVRIPPGAGALPCLFKVEEKYGMKDIG